MNMDRLFFSCLVCALIVKAHTIYLHGSRTCCLRKQQSEVQYCGMPVSDSKLCQKMGYFHSLILSSTSGAKPPYPHQERFPWTTLGAFCSLKISAFSFLAIAISDDNSNNMSDIMILELYCTFFFQNRMQKMDIMMSGAPLCKEPHAQNLLCEQITGLKRSWCSYPRRVNVSNKTHPAYTIHKDGMWLPQWLD